MQGKYFDTKLVLLFLTSILFGCAGAETYHLYKGNPRPLSEIATIKPWHETRFMPIGSLDVWPVSIDGQITEAYSGALPSYYLLPGEHKIVIGFIWTEGSNRVAGEDPEEMLFNAEVGHLYLTKAYMPKKMAEGQVRVSFWIEDANTGEVVAGTRPVTAK